MSSRALATLLFLDFPVSLPANPSQGFSMSLNMPAVFQGQSHQQGKKSEQAFLSSAEKTTDALILWRLKVPIIACIFTAPCTYDRMIDCIACFACGACCDSILICHDQWNNIALRALTGTEVVCETQRSNILETYHASNLRAALPGKWCEKYAW